MSALHCRSHFNWRNKAGPFDSRFWQSV